MNTKLFCLLLVCLLTSVTWVVWGEFPDDHDLDPEFASTEYLEELADLFWSKEDAPAGSDGMVQFNNSGAFGAKAAFSYSSTTDTLSIDNLSLAGGDADQFLQTDGGGTLTWADASITGLDTQVLFFDGANNPAGDAEFTYNKTTDTLTTSQIEMSPVIIGASPVAAGGAGAISIGENSNAAGSIAISLGYLSNSQGAGATALGQAAIGYGQNSTAIGRDANSQGVGSISVGYQSKANANTSISIGTNTQALGVQSVSLGDGAKSGGEYSIAVGVNSNAAAQGSIAEGFFSNAVAADSIASGNFSIAVGTGTMAYGKYARAAGTDSISIGTYSNAANANAIAIGENSNGQHTDAISIGRLTDGYTQDIQIGLGASAYSIVGPAVAIGSNANGRGFITSNTGGVAIGANSNAFRIAVAVGNSANGALRGAAIGELSHAYNYGIAFGYTANGENRGFAIGYGASGTDSSVAMGEAAQATGVPSIAIGPYTGASGAYAVTLGSYANSTHTNSVAIGKNANTTEDNQISIPTTYTLRVGAVETLSNVSHVYSYQGTRTVNGYYDFYYDDTSDDTPSTIISGGNGGDDACHAGGSYSDSTECSVSDGHTTGLGMKCLFRMKVEEAEDLISQFSVDAEVAAWRVVMGSPTEGWNLDIWDDNGSSWSNQASGVGQAPASATFTISSNVVNYIDSNGYVYFKLYPTAPVHFVGVANCEFDYFKLTVDADYLLLQEGSKFSGILKSAGWEPNNTALPFGTIDNPISFIFSKNLHLSDSTTGSDPNKLIFMEKTYADSAEHNALYFDLADPSGSYLYPIRITGSSSASIKTSGLVYDVTGGYTGGTNRYWGVQVGTASQPVPMKTTDTPRTNEHEVRAFYANLALDTNNTSSVMEGYYVQAIQDQAAGAVTGLRTAVSGGAKNWTVFSEGTSHLAMAADNAKLVFGSGTNNTNPRTYTFDSSIYYNGTNLIINSDDIGSGSVLLNDGVTVYQDGSTEIDPTTNTRAALEINNTTILNPSATAQDTLVVNGVDGGKDVAAPSGGGGDGSDVIIEAGDSGGSDSFNSGNGGSIYLKAGSMAAPADESDGKIILGDGTTDTNNMEISPTGDTIWKGTGGLAYAGISAYDSNATVTIAGTGIANKVQITVFDTVDVSNNMGANHANDDLTCTHAGYYKCDMSVTLDSLAGSAAKFGVILSLDNGTSNQTQCHFHRNMPAGAGGNAGTGSVTCIIDCPAASTIEAWLYNDTNTQNVVIDDINLNCFLVGGT